MTITRLPRQASDRAIGCSEAGGHRLAALQRAAPGLAWRAPKLGLSGTPASSLLRDALLTLLTLGLYRCWLRTRARQRLWGSIHLDGVPLRYSGTVRDLLVPALAAIGGILTVALVIWIAKMLAVPKPRITPTPWRLVVTVPLVYVLGMTAWRHRAFLVERTWLGDVAGRLEGSRHAYALRHFLTSLAVPLTLGWILPFRQVMLQRLMIEGMRLGSHRFTFEGDARALLGRFAVAWLGVIVVYLSSVLAIAFSNFGRKISIARKVGTFPVPDSGDVAMLAVIAAVAGIALAFLLAWYRIGAWRYFAAWTRLDGRTLRLDVRTIDYLAFFASNMALRSGTFYLLSAVAEERHARFIFSRLRIA